MVLRNKILQACYQNPDPLIIGNSYPTHSNGHRNGQMQNQGSVLTDRNTAQMNHIGRHNPVVAPPMFNPWYTNTTGIENQSSVVPMPPGGGSFVPQTRTWQPSYTQQESYGANMGSSLQPKHMRDQMLNVTSQAQYQGQSTHVPVACSPPPNGNLPIRFHHITPLITTGFSNVPAEANKTTVTIPNA